jgi:hypothetical protein
LHTYLFILLLTSVPNTAYAENMHQYSIGMSEIPNLLGINENNQGPYNKIVDRLFGTDNSIEVKFLPPSRAEKLFAEKKLDCLFPGHIAVMDNRHALIQSAAVNINNAYIFSIKTYTTLDNFGKQHLSTRRGLSYGEVVTRIKARYLEVNSDKQNIELLQLGRIDGFIAYLLDAKAAYQQLGVPIHYYNPELPVYSIPESLICYDTPANQKLINASNQNISEMFETKEIQRWLDVDWTATPD